MLGNDIVQRVIANLITVAIIYAIWRFWSAVTYRVGLWWTARTRPLRDRYELWRYGHHVPEILTKAGERYGLKPRAHETSDGFWHRLEYAKECELRIARGDR